MTYGGGPSDPFGSDPFGAAPNPPGAASPGFSGAPPIMAGFPPPPGPQRPAGEVNNLATLSVIFAFVFAPAGAVLGHIALTQIKRFGQRGRERALIGLTLSYVFIVLAVLALVIWAASGGSDSSPSVASTTATSTTKAAPPPPRTTVITAPPSERPTVKVEDLQVGDCVEVQQREPEGRPGTNIIYIYRAPCQVRDGIFRVDLISARDECTVQTLFNKAETLFACISSFRG